MSRGWALLVAVVIGALLAQFLYQIVGMAIFTALMPFGLDDDLWNDDQLSTIVLIAVALACWGASSWFIWRALIRRGEASKRPD